MRRETKSKHSLLLQLAENIGVTCPCQEFPGIWAHSSLQKDVLGMGCPLLGSPAEQELLPWAQWLAYLMSPGAWTASALSAQETKERTESLSCLTVMKHTWERIKLHANLIVINN